jgi:hypothetical protein
LLKANQTLSSNEIVSGNKLTVVKYSATSSPCHKTQLKSFGSIYFRNTQPLPPPASGIKQSVPPKAN